MAPRGLGSKAAPHPMAAAGGLAVQLYEATLVADDSPFDRFKDGTGSLTAAQLRGLQTFSNRAGCIRCHGGPETTIASVNEVQARGKADTGFDGIGVRPPEEDPGILDVANNLGRFKFPGLRNVELTGPYFHNGGKATLRQVVQFYNRAGDFPSPLTGRAMTEAQQNDLVAFLLSLTDERVRIQSAPFDHPELCIPNGHTGDATAVTDADGDGEADDDTLCLPAVGAAGDPASPLRPFLDLDPFVPD